MTPRILGAEFLGSAVLVLVPLIVQAAMMSDGGRLRPLDLAIAVGLTVIALTAFGTPLGAGLSNPALTLAAAVARRIAPARAAAVAGVQFAGGLFAVLLGRMVIPDDDYIRIYYGALGVARGYSDANAWAGDALFAMILGLVYLGCVPAGPRATGGGAIATGAAAAVGVLCMGTCSLGLLNPARALAPVIVFTTSPQSLPVFFLAPLLGAGVAGVIHAHLLHPDSAPASPPVRAATPSATAPSA